MGPWVDSDLSGRNFFGVLPGTSAFQAATHPPMSNGPQVYYKDRVGPSHD
jgi:hypothetical protein